MNQENFTEEPKKYFSKRPQVLLVLFLIIALRVWTLAVLDRHTYWTFDEPWNTETAKKVLDEHQFHRVKDSFTPISIANVWLGEKLMEHFHKLDKLTSYRVAGVVLNQAAIPLAYIFAIELGATTTVALIFTALLGFDPNILGHILLASNVDGYIFTWFLLLAVVAFRWSNKRNFLNLALFGLTLGLAQGIKLTSAYAVPLALIWLIAVLFQHQKKKKLQTVSIFLGVSWFGLCLFYAFNKLGTPLGQIAFTSQTFQKLAGKMSWLPAPVPVDYLQGLDMCLQTDTSPRPVYIRNEFLLHGVWYYFFYALLLKAPLPTLISSICGWFIAAKKKIWNEKLAFVVLFGVALMIYFSFFFNAQIGIRYLFPIYGFLAAGLIFFPWKKLTIGVAVLWMSFTWFYNWPNFIGYFNETVMTKHHRWWHLGDSNLTWNQEWKDWPKFIDEHRLKMDQIGPATFPLDIPFYEDAITISGVLSNRAQLEVLRDHFSPLDSFWGTKLRYLVTSKEVLATFPPENFDKKLEASARLTTLKPCGEPGWIQATTQGVYQELNAKNLPPGVSKFQSQVNIIRAGPVFFELASHQASTLTMSGEPVITNNAPTPRLGVKMLNLEAGVYDLEITYEKVWDDGFISIRAFALDPTTQIFLPLNFCGSPGRPVQPGDNRR